MIEKRIIEGGFIEVNNNVNTANDGQASENVAVTATTSAVTTTAVNGSSPVKRKLKFSDEMRKQVFEIVRLESDLNNLICLSNFMETSNSATASNENVGLSGGATLRSVQSELNLRKNVYQKLMNLSTESENPTAAPLLSTTEISKEFGSQKRKHEKKVSKAASEILFGEGEVEEFLKELDVRKETTDTVITVGMVNDSTTATIGNNTLTTPTNNTLATNTLMDPLNLFNNDHSNNDQSNTSLFIDSNQ